MNPGPGGDDLARLRRLWQSQSVSPFPAGSKSDRSLHELALYASWMAGIVEPALAAGEVTPAHLLLLEQRRAEGNAGVWAAAADLGTVARSYLARLIAIEDLLVRLGSRP